MYCSGQKPQLLGPLNGLGSSFGVQFYKKIGGMCLYRVKRNKKLIGYFLVREPFGHQFQNFIFPFTDAGLLQHLFINLKYIANRRLRNMDNDFFPGEL